MSSCCTLRLKRRKAFSRDSPSCSRISAKQTHPQTRPEGPSSYYKILSGSQVGGTEKSCRNVLGLLVNHLSPDIELLSNHRSVGSCAPAPESPPTIPPIGKKRDARASSATY